MRELDFVLIAKIAKMKAIRFTSQGFFTLQYVRTLYLCTKCIYILIPFYLSNSWNWDYQIRYCFTSFKWSWHISYFRFYSYSCNKITTTQIQISRQNWNGFFSNISHQMMIQLTPIVSRAKSKWYKPKKVKKLALNSQLLTVQILTNGVQVLILCPSYFITTVHRILYSQWNFCKIMSHCFHRNAHCDKIRPSRWCLHYCRNYLILSIYYPFWFKTDIIGEFICDRSIFQTFWRTHTLKLQAVDRSTIPFWNFLAKGHST